jgi:hypothetical protein
MPIKDPTIYPPYWKQFSEYIRFERAKNKCEKCDAPNGMWKAIWSIDGDHSVGYFENSNDASLDEDFAFLVRKPTLIVLTVAHLDNEGGVCDCKARTGLKCADPSHVLALCQACHLALDLPKHIENRRITLRDQRDSRRSLFNQISEVPSA